MLDGHALAMMEKPCVICDGGDGDGIGIMTWVLRLFSAEL